MLHALTGQKQNSPARVYGFAGMNFSPIPAKRHSYSSPSVISNDRREWARRMESEGLFLAEYADQTEKA